MSVTSHPRDIRTFNVYMQYACSDFVLVEDSSPEFRRALCDVNMVLLSLDEQTRQDNERIGSIRRTHYAQLDFLRAKHYKILFNPAATPQEKDRSRQEVLVDSISLWEKFDLSVREIFNDSTVALILRMEEARTNNDVDWEKVEKVILDLRLMSFNRFFSDSA